MSCILYILTFYQLPMEDGFSCLLVYLSGWNIIFSEMALCSLHFTPRLTDFIFKSAWCICRPLVMRNGCNLVLLSVGSYLDAQLSTQLARVGITRHSQPFFGVKDKLNLLPVCLLVICHVFWFWIILACILVACIPVCLFVWSLSTHRTLHSRWLQMKGPLPIPLHVIMHLLMSTLRKILIFRKIWSNFT